MFEERNHRRNFYREPQSITSLVGAFLEPAVIVLVFVAATTWFEEPILRPDLTLCLLVVLLTFPGRNRFYDRPLNAAVDISASWFSLIVILTLCGYATRSLHFFDRRVMIWWALLTPAVLWCMFFAGRKLLRRQAAQRENWRKVVVIGAGPLAVRVAQAMVGRGMTGVDFAGYFDDRGDSRLDAQAQALRLGTLSDAAPYIRAHGVHEVYITLPLGSQPRIQALLEQVQGTTSSIFFVPDVFGISIIQGRLQDMNGIPIVGLCNTPFTGTNSLVKRISDLALGSIILLLISPLLLAIAIGVKLSSPGPVVFRQRRNGLAGEEIIIWKFRSMTTQDNGSLVPQATRGDPRTTKFGAFLRRTSLDELPQFFNVLAGHMSIVGPRPHAVAHNEQYRELIKAYMVRHKVKPGITGWAQVNGHRGETDTIEKMRARVEFDLAYLHNWSLRLDLQIIARTVKLVFFDRHAY